MKILVCDDEPEVVEYVAVVLEQEGHQVDTAKDGQDALDKILDSPNPFDVLITDNRMPKLTGIELAQTLRTMNAPLKMIMISGFSNLSEAGVDEGGLLDGFLSKPFESDELLDCLNNLGLEREVADSRGQAGRFP